MVAQSQTTSSFLFFSLLFAVAFFSSPKSASLPPHNTCSFFLLTLQQLVRLWVQLLEHSFFVWHWEALSNSAVTVWQHLFLAVQHSKALAARCFPFPSFRSGAIAAYVFFNYFCIFLNLSFCMLDLWILILILVLLDLWTLILVVLYLWILILVLLDLWILILLLIDFIF